VNSHGRRRQDPVRSGPGPSGPAQFGWALLVIAAALIGGLAAATLVHASLIIAVIVSVVAGGIGVMILFRSPARSPELTAGGRQEDADTGRFPVSRRPAPPASQAAPAVQLLPLAPQPGKAAGSGPPDAPWWNSAQGAPLPSAGAKRAPAPDLSTYLASTFIAQCPRCGAFRLDIRRARNGLDFRCESCDYTWTWQPGTPWPPVRVMPP
jgi:hypothetical protein